MEKKNEKQSQILSANAFSGRTDGFTPRKHEFNDTYVKEYALVNKITETKENGEVLICASPVVVKEYDMAKEVEKRAKGQSLKEIVARLEFQGIDPVASLGATADEAIYDPTGKKPLSLGEALDKGLASDNFLSNFSESELSNLVKLAKMDEKQLSEYFASINAKQEIKQEIKKDGE